MYNKTGAIIIEGHVQGLSNVRSLGEAGIPVIVIDTHNCIARYSRYCLDFFKCPDFQSAEFINFLINLGIKKNLKGWILIPSNDHIVFNLSQNLDSIKQHYKTLVPPVNQLMKIYNKQNLLDIANSINVPFPKTYYPDSPELNDFKLNFPVIIKGKYGLTFYKTFGRKAFFAKDKLTLKRHLENIKSKIELNNVFVQEIIPGTEINKAISYTAFSENGIIKTYWIGQKIREHPWTFGTATFTESVYNDVVKKQAEKLIQEMKYTGVCEIEFIFHSADKKYMLIEINPRTWLWVGLAKANGINYALYMYNYLNGIEINYPVSYTTGIKWRNTWPDMFYSVQAILKGKMSLHQYLVSLKSTVVSGVESTDDPKPFKAMTRMLLSLAIRR